MYTDRNFKSAKELRLAVVRYLLTVCGRDSTKARPVTFYQPGPFGGNVPADGNFVVEGPHYPAPHSFYVKCVSRGDAIVWCTGLPQTLNPESKSYNLSSGIATLRDKFPEIEAKVNPKMTEV